MKILLVALLCCFSAHALYSSKSPVVQLTQKNFREKVLESGQFWLVEFYAPWCGHCKAFAPEYEKAARALKGVAKVGAVDMTTDQSVGQPYGVTGFPTVKLFPGSRKAVDYNSERTAAALTKFIFQEMKNTVKNRLSGKADESSSGSSGREKSDQEKENEKKFQGSGSSGGGDPGDKEVVVLEDDDFDEQVYNSKEPWLVEFYAPWCGHCKALAPEWNKAAVTLKGAVKVAKVDATENNKLAGQFGVNSYPTLKFFRPGAPKKASWAEDYTGARDHEGIVNWANNKLVELGYVPDIEQLTSETQYNDKCKGANKVCVITFLPHILDSSAKERNQQLEFIKKVAGKNRGAVEIMWSQGGDQLEFERKLNLSFGYPAVVALSLEKQRYVIMKGEFTEFKLSAFITGLLYGKERLGELPKNMPKIMKVAGWDGKDGELPQEDF